MADRRDPRTCWGEGVITRGGLGIWSTYSLLSDDDTAGDDGFGCRHLGGGGKMMKVGMISLE